jgi:hypothetical protein
VYGLEGKGKIGAFFILFARANNWVDDISPASAGAG